MKIKVAQPLTQQQVELLMQFSIKKIESLIRTRMKDSILEEDFFEYMTSLKSFFDEVIIMYQMSIQGELDQTELNIKVGETKKITNIKKWKK